MVVLVLERRAENENDHEKDSSLPAIVPLRVELYRRPTPDAKTSHGSAALRPNRLLRGQFRGGVCGRRDGHYWVAQNGTGCGIVSRGEGMAMNETANVFERDDLQDAETGEGRFSKGLTVFHGGSLFYKERDIESTCGRSSFF